MYQKYMPKEKSARQMHFQNLTRKTHLAVDYLATTVDGIN